MKPQGTQLSLFETRSLSDPFAVRVSPRARRLTARVHVGGRVEIVVPVGVNAHAVRDFVQRFTPWINRKVAAMRCFVAPMEAMPPSIELTFTGEYLDVEWRRGPTRKLEQHSGRIVVPNRGAGTGRFGGPRFAAGLAEGCGGRAADAAAAAAGGRPEVFRVAGEHSLSADALGKLLDARYRELELLLGVSAPGCGALFVHP